MDEYLLFLEDIEFECVLEGLTSITLKHLNSDDCITEASDDESAISKKIEKSKAVLNKFFEKIIGLIRESIQYIKNTIFEAVKKHDMKVMIRELKKSVKSNSDTVEVIDFKVYERILTSYTKEAEDIIRSMETDYINGDLTPSKVDKYTKKYKIMEKRYEALLDKTKHKKVKMKTSNVVKWLEDMTNGAGNWVSDNIEKYLKSIEDCKSKISSFNYKKECFNKREGYINTPTTFVDVTHNTFNTIKRNSDWISRYAISLGMMMISIYAKKRSMKSSSEEEYNKYTTLEVLSKAGWYAAAISGKKKFNESKKNKRNSI